MSRAKKANSRNPAKTPAGNRQPPSDANARDMAGKVIRAATGESQRLRGGRYTAAAAADPLAWWFIMAYSGRLALGFQECGHLLADPSLTQHWDSAVPTAVLCETCIGPGHDDRLTAHELLPARCGRCGQAGGTHTVDAVLDHTRILGRVCTRCHATQSPSGGARA